MQEEKKAYRKKLLKEAIVGIITVRCRLLLYHTGRAA
jgi:hypothetical protein